MRVTKETAFAVAVVAAVTGLPKKSPADSSIDFGRNPITTHPSIDVDRRPSGPDEMTDTRVCTFIYEMLTPEGRPTGVDVTVNRFTEITTGITRVDLFDRRDMSRRKPDDTHFAGKGQTVELKLGSSPLRPKKPINEKEDCMQKTVKIPGSKFVHTDSGSTPPVTASLDAIPAGNTGMDVIGGYHCTLTTDVAPIDWRYHSDFGSRGKVINDPSQREFIAEKRGRSGVVVRFTGGKVDPNRTPVFNSEFDTKDFAISALLGNYKGYSKFACSPEPQNTSMYDTSAFITPSPTSLYDSGMNQRTLATSAGK